MGVRNASARKSYKPTLYGKYCAYISWTVSFILMGISYMFYLYTYKYRIPFCGITNQLSLPPTHQTPSTTQQ